MMRSVIDHGARDRLSVTSRRARRTHDHDQPDLPPPSLEEVGEGVYAYVQLDGSPGG